MNWILVLYTTAVAANVNYQTHSVSLVGVSTGQASLVTGIPGLFTHGSAGSIA